MIPLPKEIIDQITMFCEANEMGFSIVVTNDIQIFLMGVKGISATHSLVIGASMLLNVVLEQDVEENNENAKKQIANKVLN